MRGQVVVYTVKDEKTRDSLMATKPIGFILDYALMPAIRLIRKKIRSIKGVIIR